MANVNSLTSSNSYSSIYGTRNVLTGLASGLDTEAMIENSVSGYKTKITQLQQQMESLTWKQDAYRSITDKMIALLDKFTSYTSKTNLASSSFFSQAVRTIVSGTNASKVSATGKSSSDVQINSITSLASAAKYKVDGSKIAGGATGVGGEVDWTQTQTVSAIAGSSMTIDFGGKDPLVLKFDENDVYSDVGQMVDGINKKLEAAGTGIKVKASGSNIEFVDANGSSFNASVKDVTGPLSNLVTKNGDGQSFTVNANGLTERQSMEEYLSGKSINVTYNGTTKSISLSDLKKNLGSDGDYTQALAKTIQDGVDSAFGKGRITVGVDGQTKGLSFGVAENSGSTLKVTSDAGEALGIGSGLSNYLDTSKTLGDLLGKDKFAGGAQELKINGETIGTYGADTKLSTILSDINNNSNVGVTVSFSPLTNEFVFTTKDTGADQRIDFNEGLASDLFKADTSPKSKTLGDLFGDGIKWNENGEAALSLAISEGGGSTPLGTFGKNTTLQELMDKLGPYKDIIQYDEDTGEYKLGDKREFSIKVGGTGSISFKDLVDNANIDTNFTAGTDAVLTATINGKEMTMQRSTNTVEIDGLSVTLKDKFVTGANEEAVSFKTSTDSDKIVDSVKAFVDEYNALMKEIHDAYTTQPLTDSKKNKYSPLTEDDKADMSDSAIERYEEKAKTGLLFADSDLSSLYTKMTSMISSTLSEIGITAAYSSGDRLSQLSLDEDKLRDVLEKDPNKVKDAFTSSKALGGSSDGLMTKVKDLFNTYASKSIGSPGILVNKAGTKLSSYSLTHNEVQKQIDQLQEKIDSWQLKLNKKIDYYTRQFTALESLMSTMNNQSSMLSGLMGGY